MNKPSAEQQSIITAPLEPMSVVACAGSGKTRTAVYRIIEMSKKLGVCRGRIALLSFSNVAVDTFRADFKALAGSFHGNRHGRIEISTMDSFLDTNILRPHAYRAMKCERMPFLVTGNEPFLENKNLKFWHKSSAGKTFPLAFNEIVVDLRDGEATSQFQQHGKIIPVDNGIATIEALGKRGAYTHNVGRYWCYRILTEEPRFLHALAHRYPHVLIDEAQDTGTIHQAILELLAKAGSQISLIGDPHQGIYEFAGADGKFLIGYGKRHDVKPFGLTCNYRSVPAILTLANRLSSREDTAGRSAPATQHGAFFVSYKNSNIEKTKLISAFCSAIQSAGLKIGCSAVVCRNRKQVNELNGNSGALGKGVVKDFALAAIHRDKHQDYMTAFTKVAGCIARLTDEPPPKLATMITQPACDKEMDLRREVWKFIRSVDSGLPRAILQADTEWHPLLRERVRILLKRLSDCYGLTPAPNLGHKLTKAKLPSHPLMPSSIIRDEKSIRIDTVHQVKGESLDAVLYIADKNHVEALLQGVDTEVGRIGYVAVTRAKNIFWLGVPSNAIQKLRPKLEEHGFQEIVIS